MDICELKNTDEKSWDEYVLKHPDSTFYHQTGWKHVVENSYGHKPYYLLAKEDGEIKGVLPLFFMKSLLFGREACFAAVCAVWRGGGKPFGAVYDFHKIPCDSE